MIGVNKSGNVQRSQSRSRYIALKIAGIYGLLGLLWITFSDMIVARIASDPAVITSIQTFKGWLYVFVTVWLVYYLIKKQMLKIQSAHEVIRRKNRALAVRSECNQALVLATDEGDLLRNTCRILVEIGGYRLAWIGFAEQDEGKSVHTVAQTGYDEGYLDTLNITWDDTERGRGPTGTAIRTGRPVASRYILTGPEFAPWREAAIERGYASSISLPLIAGERTFGALNIYSHEQDAFDKEEEKLLMELADDVARGIMVLRTREEYRKVGEALRESTEQMQLALWGGDLGTWDWNIETGDVMFNKRWVEMLGYTLDEIEPRLRAWEKLIHPDEIPDVKKVLNAHLEGKVDFYETEYRLRHKSGGWIWVLVKGRVIERDADGKSLRTCGTHLDITEHKKAEEALKESFEIINKSPAVAFLWKNAESWPVEYVSENVRNLYGYSAEDFMLGRVSYSEIIHPEDLEEVTEEVTRNSNDKERSDFVHKPYRIITKDGQVRWIDDRTNIRRDKNGQITHYQGIVHDITERKRAETALHESQNRLRRLSEATIEGIVITDQGKIIEANKQAARLLGCELEDLIGMNVIDFVAPDSLDFVLQKIRNGFEASYEHMAMRIDGSTFPIEVQGHSILFEGRSARVTTIRDLSERKKAEDDLRESEEKLSKAFDASPAIIMILDLENMRRLYMNEAYEKVFGISRKEAIGTTFDDFNLFLDYEKIKTGLKRLVIEKKMYNFEAELRIKKGRFITLLINAAVLDIPGKRLAVIVASDITERKQVDEALRNALEVVEQLKTRLQAENIYLQEEIKIEHNFDQIIGRSKKLKNVLRQVEQVASSNATVLVLGETGTGKELIARAIHGISDRKDRPLIKVNCAALPANLIESELFGYEKGAFTGAVSRRIGRFELAHRGTILLDEIGDLPLDLQAKLLRVLQEGEFERLGGMKTIKVDVRVIAVTNRNLEKALETGQFREDLYHRLNVFPIIIPPLRERKEDIPVLAAHFVSKCVRKTGKQINQIPRKVMDELKAFDWPGNIRGLENIIERAVLSSCGDKLLLGEWLPKSGTAAGSTRIPTLLESEKEHIFRALRAVHWRVSGDKGAAEILGINPKTLESRLRKLNIKRPL